MYWSWDVKLKNCQCKMKLDENWGPDMYPIPAVLKEECCFQISSFVLVEWDHLFIYLLVWGLTWCIHGFLLDLHLRITPGRVPMAICDARNWTQSVMSKASVQHALPSLQPAKDLLLTQLPLNSEYISEVSWAPSYKPSPKYHPNMCHQTSGVN